MADDIDKAQDQEQMTRDAILRAARDDKPHAECTGYCLQCGEPVEAPRRWCDNQCRDDWQRWNPGL